MPKPKEQEWRKRQIENEWEKTKIHFLFVFIVERFYKLNLSTAVCLRLSVYLCYVATWKNISRSHSPLFSSFWLNFYDIYCEHWGICQRMFFVSDRTTHIHKHSLSPSLSGIHVHICSLRHAHTLMYSVAYSFTIFLAHTHRTNSHVRIYSQSRICSLLV